MKQILKLIRRRIGRAYSAFAGIVRNLAQSGTVAFKISLKLPLPPALEWNGLPINTAAGLEAGLIEMIQPPWNKMGIKG